MSEGNIEVTMTLKEAKFITGLLNASRAQDKLDDGFIKIARDAAKAEADIKRFADQTTKINVTPLEAYDATVVKLDASLKKGLITQETYTRAIERAKKEKDDADGTTKKLADEEARMAKVAQDAANALKREADELKRFGDETRRINATPLENYNQQVEKLNTSLAAGAINQETYARAVERAKKEMADADGTTKRLADQEAKVEKEAKEAANALKREADELKRFGDETRKVNATPIERYREQVAKLDAALRTGAINQETYARAVGKAKEELKEAGTATESAVGMEIGTKLGAAAAGWATIGTTVSAVTKVIQHAKQQTDAALEAMKGQRDIDRDLNQISTSSQDFQEKKARANAAAIKYGTSREDAKKVLLESVNQGFEKDYEYVMRANQVINPVDAALVAGKLPMLFKGNVNTKEALNMTLVASQMSEMNFGQMAGGVATASVGAGMAGASPEETLAMQAALASNLKNGAQAGERINTFGMKISREEFRDVFQGKSMIEAAQMMEMDKSLKKKVLGDDQEGNAAQFLILQERERILRFQKAITDARSKANTDQSAIDQGVARAEADPDMRARRQLATAEQQRELAMQNNLAVPGAAREAAKARVEAAAHRRGAGPVESSWADWAGYAAVSARASEENVTKATSAGAGAGFAFERLFKAMVTTSGGKTMADEMSDVKTLLQEQNTILRGNQASQTENSRNQTRTSAALPSLVK